MLLAPLLLAALLAPLTQPVDGATSADSAIVPSSEVAQFLEQHGLPGGLLPALVTSYSLTGADNSTFVVHLQHECYHKFDNLVWYDTTIKGKLGYGKIESLSGIQAQEFFWLPVTGIRVDSNPKYIYFEVGFLSKKLSASLFQEPPSCSKSSRARLDLDLAVQ